MGVNRHPYLSLYDVGVVYPGGMRALHPTTLSFEKGECVVLLGTSGAGKSTLLRTINLLVSPTQGSITLQGRDPTKSAVRLHRRRIGMVFQQHQLHRMQSVFRNVLNGRIGYRSVFSTLLPWSHADKILALQCLERVGLLDRANSRAGQLSGGQQQRVGVARALAQRPEILLADEPVASLDPTSAEGLLHLIQSISRDLGVLAIISLHHVELARRFADRIVGLNSGRVVFDGPPSELDRAALAAIYGGRAKTEKNHVTSPAAPTEDDLAASLPSYAHPQKDTS